MFGRGKLVEDWQKLKDINQRLHDDLEHCERSLEALRKELHNRRSIIETLSAEIEQLKTGDAWALFVRDHLIEAVQTIERSGRFADMGCADQLRWLEWLHGMMGENTMTCLALICQRA